jgi:hypothetical protein
MGAFTAKMASAAKLRLHCAIARFVAKRAAGYISA